MTVSSFDGHAFNRILTRSADEEDLVETMGHAGGSSPSMAQA